MANGIPQPNSEQVFEQIAAVLTRLTHYVSPTDWNFKRLKKLAEQLSNADEVEGASALASVWQMTGDRDKAIRYMDFAIQHADNPAFYVCGKIVLLCNLGYFSEALKDFQGCSAPEKGNMTHSWQRGYLCGAFRTMVSYLPMAKKMQFDLVKLDVDTAARAARVMEASGVTDEDIAKVLDVAGIVLREHRLFFVGDGPRVNVFDSEDADALLDISLDIAGSPSAVHALYREFVDRLVASVPVLPSVLAVSFQPSKQQDERNAA